jgi:hypothetical protein
MNTNDMLENLKGRDHSDDLGVNENILEKILQKQGLRIGLDSSGSG